MVIIHCKLWNR